MKPYLVYTLLFIGCLCMSCNASRRIHIENKTADDAEITWVLKEDSLHKSYLYVSNSDTVRFQLKNKSPYNRLKLSAGNGSWTPVTLTDFADDLHYLLLQWNTGFIRLDSTQRITDFLLLRRRGIDNSQVKIVLN